VNSFHVVTFVFIKRLVLSITGFDTKTTQFLLESSGSRQWAETRHRSLTSEFYVGQIFLDAAAISISSRYGRSVCQLL